MRVINYLGYERARNFLGLGSSSIAAQDTDQATPEASHGGGGGGGIGHGFLSDGSKMYRGISGSGNTVVLNHHVLRQNARKAYHETPQAKAVVDRYADSVADTGLRLEATPKANMLGISDVEAEEWGRAREEEFDLYCRAKEQHRSEQSNLYQQQRLYQIMQHRDNDIFTRLYYSDDKDLLSPLQFEFIDPNQIRGYGFTSTFGINGFDDGITRDERGREKEYRIWLREKTTPGTFKDVTIPAKSADGRRLVMLHGFMSEYASQGRGYSRLSHALQEFQQITDFSLSTIIKAINQTQFVAKVVPSKDEDAPDILEGLRTNAGIGPAASAIGSNPCPPTGAQNVSAESLQPVTCYQVDEFTNRQAGGLFVANLTKGSDLQMLDTKAPADSFDVFVDAFTSYITSSMGMPLEVLLMKFGENFSASRGALLLFWRVVQIWRDEMAADFLNPIYAMWLSEEIAVGRVNAPGWSDPRMRAAWLSASWIGSPAPDIDPSKTANAALVNMKLGALTGKRHARNLNGSDFSANYRTLGREWGEFPPPPWRAPALQEEKDMDDENKNRKSDDD